MRSIIIKMFLIGLVLYIGKLPAFGQNTDIKCEVGGLNLNLSQTDPGYGFNFESFSLFADGEEKEGAVGVAKYYKLPRTKLILSVGVGYVLNGKTSSSPQLITMMNLGKKKVPISPDAEAYNFFDEITKHAVSHVQVRYPLAAFDKGGEGTFYMPFLGKKKPIQIFMTCKKVSS